MTLFALMLSLCLCLLLVATAIAPLRPQAQPAPVRRQPRR